ncbi:MAG: hypothetical protein IT378_18135 [Sandaracinaceae bacterium]|nr:hypothetical protein [Sandaracinaceae bacterium]
MRSACSLALALGALAACGGTRPDAERPEDERPENERPGSETAAPSPASAPARPPCPSSFASPGPSCTQGNDPGDCTYPEGNCFCGQDDACSGAIMPPVPPAWVCVRGPAMCPIGAPCAPGSPPCGARCCGTGIHCVRGVWTEQFAQCPP